MRRHGEKLLLSYLIKHLSLTRIPFFAEIILYLINKKEAGPEQEIQQLLDRRILREKAATGADRSRGETRTRAITEVEKGM